ncbi:MAG: hypothetical protein AB1486_16225, partial [Planctomycetota bacterium]
VLCHNAGANSCQRGGPGSGDGPSPTSPQATTSPQPAASSADAAREAAKKAAKKAARGGGKWTKEVIERKAPGADGATSRHIIEKLDGKTNSVTHQVTKDGKVIHQHQTHIGKHGTQRQFPDEWVEYPKVPGGGQ